MTKQKKKAVPEARFWVRIPQPLLDAVEAHDIPYGWKSQLIRRALRDFADELNTSTSALQKNRRIAKALGW